MKIINNNKFRKMLSLEETGFEEIKKNVQNWKKLGTI